jgi:hypothetical protein
LPTLSNEVLIITRGTRHERHRYTWRALINLVALVFTLGVLASLRGRTELLIVPILGLMYTAHRTVAMGQGKLMLHMAGSIQEILEKMRTVSGETFVSELDDFKKQSHRVQILWYIDIVFLAIISLTCMYWLFSSGGYSGQLH